MCCNKSWPLWLGLVGLMVGVAVVRQTHHLRAQPPPPAPVESTRGPVGPLGPGRVQPPQVAEGVRNNLGKPAPAVVFETKAEGYGVEMDDAATNAVEAARKAVITFLADKYGESYEPSAETLKAKQIVGTPEYETANTPKTSDVSNSPVLKAVVTVKLNSDQVKELRNEARKERAVGRLKTTGFGLAGLVALLLVGGGYLRLEEATKGYYTTLLRIGALGLVSAIAAGIYMLWS